MFGQWTLLTSQCSILDGFRMDYARIAVKTKNRLVKSPTKVFQNSGFLYCKLITGPITLSIRTL